MKTIKLEKVLHEAEESLQRENEVNPDPFTKEQRIAINMISAGAKMLGWDISICSNKDVEGLIIGSQAFIEGLVEKQYA